MDETIPNEEQHQLVQMARKYLNQDCLSFLGVLSSASVDAIQCKHYKKCPGEKEVHQWWHSLGVKTEESAAATSHVEPWEEFCKLVSKKIANECEMGERILACSFSTPYQKNRARVWFKEMFEPTISLVNLREASDSDDSDAGHFKRPPSSKQGDARNKRPKMQVPSGTQHGPL